MRITVEFGNRFYLFLFFPTHVQKTGNPLFPNFRITFLRLDVVWLISYLHNRVKMFLKEYSSDFYKCMVSTFKGIFFKFYITSISQNFLKVH